MPWRNGGGTTWEIARGAPEGAGETHWHWRFSLAEIAADGPFSAFPHVDRLLTVVAGEGIVLTIDGSEPRRLTRGEDIQFPGEAAIGCVLVAGATRDLNLMVDRRVARLAPGGDGLRIVAGEGDTVVLYALEEVALRVEAELIVVEAGDAMIGRGAAEAVIERGRAVLGAGRAAGLSMMGPACRRGRRRDHGGVDGMRVQPHEAAARLWPCRAQVFAWACAGDIRMASASRRGMGIITGRSATIRRAPTTGRRLSRGGRRTGAMFCPAGWNRSVPAGAPPPCQ